jgi:hypothetical protein
MFFQLVVDQHSATFGSAREISRPLTGDHCAITQFQNLSDPNYIVVCQVLEDIIQRNLSRNELTSVEHVPASRELNDGNTMAYDRNG